MGMVVVRETGFTPPLRVFSPLAWLSDGNWVCRKSWRLVGLPVRTGACLQPQPQHGMNFKIYNLTSLNCSWLPFLGRWRGLSLESHHPLVVLDGKEPACQCGNRRRHTFDPWVREVPWRRTWLPAPVFLPGGLYGQRSLAGYSPWGHKELDMTEQHFQLHFHPSF